jgi:hypothetical protein
MSLGNATFGGFIVGQAPRLPSNDLPTQASGLEPAPRKARRPSYIQKFKSKLLLVLLNSSAFFAQMNCCL